MIIKLLFVLLITNPLLFLFTCFTCMTVFLMRRRWIKRWWVAACYYGIPSCLLFSCLIVHNDIQKKDYTYLEVFRQLERNNKVEEAKNDPQYQHLKPVLHKFNSSKAFAEYLLRYGDVGDGLLLLLISWLGAFCFDLFFAIAYLLRRLLKRSKVALL